MNILSFDVGGTKIAWALLNERGDFVSDINKVATPSTAAEIEQIFQTAAVQYDFDGFALATAGVVNNNRVLEKPNNLPAGYEKIDIADICKTPYIIENDANAATWAEYRIGELKNVQQGVLLTIGTAVGCGLICNGMLMRGKIGAAGEYDFKFSGRDLQKLAQDYSLAKKDCFAIYDLYKQKNNQAEIAYKQWENRLIDGLQMLNRLLDIEVVALSGSLAQIVDYEFVNAAITEKEWRNPPKIVAAKCLNNAGMVGAALLCINKMKGV